MCRTEFEKIWGVSSRLATLIFFSIEYLGSLRVIQSKSRDVTVRKAPDL